LYSLRSRLESGQTVSVASDQVSTPTYNRDLAAVTIALVKAGATGIFHVAGPDAMSRFDFAKRAACLLGLDATRIQGKPTRDLMQRAARPLNAGLSTKKLHSVLPDALLRGVDAGIQDWFYAEKPQECNA
jgi:dTDP-4-dehydrorhamnose reductase